MYIYRLRPKLALTMYDTPKSVNRISTAMFRRQYIAVAAVPAPLTNDLASTSMAEFSDLNPKEPPWRKKKQ